MYMHVLMVISEALTEAIKVDSQFKLVECIAIQAELVFPPVDGMFAFYHNYKQQN